MKKILYILGALMFTSVVYHPMVAVGQEQFSGREEDVPFSTARLFSKLTESSGADADLDWGESFGADDESEIGQNLYAIIYNKVENQPELETNADVAGRYGLSTGDLNRILGGDYSSIVERRPSMTQTQLVTKVQELQNEHRAALEVARLKAQVRAAVETSEIFANGDLGDSGFDLIHDLRLIEEILFLKTDPIDIGKSYVSPSGGLAPIGQAEEFETTSEAGPPDFPSSPVVEPRGGATDETVGEGTVTSPLKDYDDELNPNSCFAENLYDDALEELEEKSKEDGDYKVTEDFQVGSLSQQLEENGFVVGEGDDPLPKIEQIRQPAVAAPEDDWSKTEICEGEFCLEVNFVEKPVTSSFQNSDNCIACHAEKIRDILKDTINHSLVPSKAPGNLGEPAMCKKPMRDAFSNVNMEIYTMMMPIQTPLNDDIIDTTDIQEEFFGLCSNDFFPFDICGLDKEEDETPKTEEQRIQEAIDEYEIPPLLDDRAGKQVLTQVADGTTQLEATERIQEVRETYIRERAESLMEYRIESTADEEVRFYDPISTEVNQMNYYFGNIRDILHSLHEEVERMPGRQACTEIKSKKECS